MHSRRLSLVALCASAGFAVFACGLPVRIPGVHEPLDSPAWKRCAGELAERESVALIDDLTLDSKTLLCQGVTLAGEGRVDEAIELLTEAGVRDKEDHRPHYLLGRILTEAGRYEEALAAFERSAKRFESMEVPTERLGRKVLETDGPQQAQLFLSKARKRGLCPYGCIGLLARLLHESGNDDKAEALYNEMIEASPGEPAAYVGLAGIRNSSGDFAEETRILQRATTAENFAELSQANRADILYSLAFARYNAGDYSKASETIDQAIALREGRADWHVLAGWIELKKKAFEAAKKRFEKASSIDPGLAAAEVGRGDALLASGDPQGAVLAYKKARKTDPTDSVTILKLAYATAVTGNLDEARKLVDEAAALDKEHLPPEILGKVTDLLKAGESSAAASE